MRIHPGFVCGPALLANLFLVAVAGPGAQSRPARPGVESQVTFLYYQDLPRAVRFYRDTLGLRPTLERDWVEILAVSPTSSIGLVNATAGSHRPSADKPVMVSLVVKQPADVDGWYEYLKSQGVEVVKPPYDSERSGVRALTFNDPEGYSLEIFAWR